MTGFTLAVALLIDGHWFRIVIGPGHLRIAGDWNWWPGGLAAANSDGKRRMMNIDALSVLNRGFDQLAG